jgi:hypothetical protein
MQWDFDGDDVGKYRRRITRHERELPAESTVWLALGVALITIAAGAAVTAIGLAGDVKISKAVLWTTAVETLLQGGMCFAVHWDTNRGRRIKHSEVEEEVECHT